MTPADAPGRASKRRIVAFSSLLVGCAILSGCTTGSTNVVSSNQPFPGSTDAPSSLNLPEQNIQQWVMPLDQYTQGSTRMFDYAQNLLVEPCMEKAGFTWSVPWQDPNGTDGPSWNEADVRITSLDLAKQWGYRLAPATDSSLASWITFSNEKANIGPSEEAALTTCVVASRKTLPVLPGSAQLASGYALAAWEGAQKDAPVVAAASKWHTCMLSAGVSDLPMNPQDMPSPSLRKQFNITLSISPVPPTVSNAEIAMATEDQNCRMSSNYSTALYKAEWDRQAKLVAQNADALQRVKATLAAQAAEISKVISSHAPSH